MNDELKRLWKTSIERWNNEIIPLVDKFRTPELKSAIEELWKLHDKMELDCHEIYDFLKAENPNVYNRFKALSDFIASVEKLDSFLLNKI